MGARRTVPHCMIAGPTITRPNGDRAGVFANASSSLTMKRLVASNRVHRARPASGRHPALPEQDAMPLHHLVVLEVSVELHVVLRAAERPARRDPDHIRRATHLNILRQCDFMLSCWLPRSLQFPRTRNFEQHRGRGGRCTRSRGRRGTGGRRGERWPRCAPTTVLRHHRFAPHGVLRVRRRHQGQLRPSPGCSCP